MTVDLTKQIAADGSIECADLVAGERRIPWVAGGRDSSGLDCAWLAHVAMRRAGLLVPDHALLPLSVADDPSAALTLYLAETDGLWEDLGNNVHAARQLGDLIVSDGKNSPHLSVLQDERSRMAITASETTGVARIRADRIGNVRAVLRWKGPRA